MFRSKNKRVIEDSICDIGSFTMSLLKRNRPNLPECQKRIIAQDLMSRANEKIISDNAPPEVFKFGENSKARKILQPRSSTISSSGIPIDAGNNSKPILKAEKPKVVGVVRKREHNKYCSSGISEENPVEHKNTCRHASASDISMDIPESKKMKTSMTCDAESASYNSPPAQNVFERLYTSRKSIRGSYENVSLCRRRLFSSANSSNDSFEKIDSVVVKKEEQGFNRKRYPSRLPRNNSIEKGNDSMSDCIDSIQNAMKSLNLNHELC
ncbi:hypothetical protein JTB14_008943 [Gonioctena quinquepunctata]|nr:hypothetical protein JTB14_008943 [Gonioctena quinquepunctata]